MPLQLLLCSESGHAEFDAIAAETIGNHIVSEQQQSEDTYLGARTHVKPA